MKKSTRDGINISEKMERIESMGKTTTPERRNMSIDMAKENSCLIHADTVHGWNAERMQRILGQLYFTDDRQLSRTSHANSIGDQFGVYGPQWVRPPVPLSIASPSTQPSIHT